MKATLLSETDDPGVWEISSPNYRMTKITGQITTEQIWSALLIFHRKGDGRVIVWKNRHGPNGEMSEEDFECWLDEAMKYSRGSAWISIELPDGGNLPDGGGELTLEWVSVDVASKWPLDTRVLIQAPDGDDLRYEVQNTWRGDLLGEVPAEVRFMRLPSRVS